MTHDTTQYDETKKTKHNSAPPLCLVHYFAERNPHPPGTRSAGRVVERRDNLIVLEFADPPAAPSLKDAFASGDGLSGLPGRLSVLKRVWQH